MTKTRPTTTLWGDSRLFLQVVFTAPKDNLTWHTSSHFMAAKWSFIFSDVLSSWYIDKEGDDVQGGVVSGVELLTK